MVKRKTTTIIFFMLPNIWACCYKIALNLGYFSSLGIFILKKILERYKEVNFFSSKKWRPRDITLTIRRKVNTIHEVGRGLSFRRKIQLV